MIVGLLVEMFKSHVKTIVCQVTLLSSYIRNRRQLYKSLAHEFTLVFTCSIYAALPYVAV